MKRKEIAELVIYDDIVETVQELVREIKRKRQRDDADINRLEKLSRIYATMEGLRPTLPSDIVTETEADR